MRGAAIRTSVAALALAGGPAARAGTVWFVRASAPAGGSGHSFASAFATLDAALAAAAGGDEIRVAAGVYVPGAPGGRSSTFVLKAGVSLYGGFAGDNDAPESRDPATYPTVLSGDRAGDDEPAWVNRADNCYRVLTATDPAIGPATVLDGFVVTGGNADGAIADGAGLYIAECEPTVRSCTFIENAAASPTQDGRGGGVAIACVSARSPRFESCRFEYNQGTFGAGVHAAGAGTDAVFRECRFLNNIAGAGGGLYLEGAGARVVNCRLLSNGAVAGDGGAACRSGGSLRLVNTEMAWNTAARHGGAVFAGCCGSLEVVNCTIVGNYAGVGTGGVRVGAGAVAEVGNSVLSENSDSAGLGQSSQVYAPATGTVSLSHCLVSGWTGSLGGAGNFGGDPLFVDAAGPDANLGTEDDNYRLLAASPCVDSGDAALLPPDATDLDGDSDTGEPVPVDLDRVVRTLDGDFDGIERTDVGAYEYHCPADFDLNNFVNGVDFDSFVELFEAGDRRADFDLDGFVTGVDFDTFTQHFVEGC